MALINCPECNHEVSTFTETCPNCGFPIDKLDAIDISQWTDEKKTEAAKNPNCPARILEKLADNSDWAVRYCVARNPNCPPSALEQLSNDSEKGFFGDFPVRKAVAKNPNCRVDTLEKLANDSDKWVRRYVAENLNCPTDVLKKLANDSEETVRRTVAHNPNCPAYEKQYLSFTRKEKCQLIDNEFETSEYFNMLICDCDGYVRYWIAKNANCPVLVLEKLANDPNEDVREAVAKNPNYRREIE